MIILICGKVCSGKTTYAKKMAKELPAVRLNPDEIMKPLLGEHLGEKHEEMLHKTLQICYRKALEIHSCGLNVIIDAGFWQKELRKTANEFFAQHSVIPVWHYVHASDETIRRNVATRNATALEFGSSDYYIDDNILAKFNDPHDAPSLDEIDVWYEQESMQ